jgi:DNA polymerase-3 subunit delta
MVVDYVKSAACYIDEKSATMLADYVGTDLARLFSEIDKLKMLVGPDKRITPDLIERNIGISKDYNNFELQNVIGRGDVAKAARIVDHFAKNQKDNPLVLTITSLYGFFSKMLIYWQYKSQGAQKQAAMMGCSPFFLKDYDTASRRLNLQKVIKCISLLREYDLKSKGVNNVSTDAGGLLEELIFKIMH